jgi:hypothetical protein
LLPQLFEQAAAGVRAESLPGAPQPPPACVSASGVVIQAGGTACSGRPLSLRLKRGAAEERRVLAAASVAAQSAAAANADAANAASYGMWGVRRSSTDAEGASTQVCARVAVSQAARLPAAAVVDTTGAGDAFIGSLLYGLATGMPVQQAMRLAAVVAACKCTALGPRPGLPHRGNLSPSLLLGQ